MDIQAADTQHPVPSSERPHILGAQNSQLGPNFSPSKLGITPKIAGIDEPP